MHSVGIIKTFKIMCSDLEFLSDQNWLIFLEKTMNYKWVILSKSGHFEHFELST